MSIPAGVTAVEVCCLPGSTSLPITQVSVQVTPTVVATWLTNGQSLASMCNTVPIPGWVMLPAVDQIGFVTAPGQGVTGWGYNVVTNWTLSDGTKGQMSGKVQVFSNQSVVYLGSNGSTFTAPANYPVGGIALNGWVAAYANLPTSFGMPDAGKAYIVQADGMLYVWSGSAWPASGQGFNLAGPSGPNGGVGPVGPSSTLTIGTVQTGAPASATLTGTAPNQVLSLTLPEGHWWTGTGAPSTIPSSMNGDLYLDTSGNGNVYQLQSGTWVFQGSLKGPTGSQGVPGATGPANSLAIGTVVNGGSAAATITGTAPSQTLNLTLPQGPTGPAGPSAPAATTTSQGIIQLAGDLAGTAAAPTVPGLTSKANTSTTISAGTGLAGGGDLSANRSLSVVYGTAASTSAQGNDTRITGAVQSTRQVISGTGLAGGGDLTADRTLTVVYGAAAGTAAQGNDTRLSDTRTPAAGTVPCDFVWVAQSGTRVTGVGDLAAGMYVGRAFTLTRVIYQFDTADQSGSTTVECRRNAAQLASSVLTVTAANQADGTATDAARTATFTQAWAVGDRFALAVTAVGTTPGKGARVYLVGTWN